MVSSAGSDDPVHSGVLDVCLVGAQKCGTSSLAAWLADHPGIGHSLVKEPYFWNVERNTGEVSTYFADQFSGTQPDQLLMESSTSYSMYPEVSGVPQRLYLHNPSMRLIYLLRDPVKRIESHLAHRWMNGRIDQIDSGIVDSDPVYLDRSRYWMQLAQYLVYFDPARIHVVFLEDLISEPDIAFARIEEFLKISNRHPCPSLPRENVSASRNGFWKGERSFARVGVKIPLRMRRVMRHHFGRKNPNSTLDDATRTALRKQLQPDIDALEAFLGYRTGWTAGVK